MSTTKQRGYAAAKATLISTRGGGGKMSPRGSVNACHRVLVIADRPMSATELATHILGLGYWSSQSEHPVNTIVGGLNKEAAKADGFLEKPEAGKAVYQLRDGAPAPLA